MANDVTAVLEQLIERCASGDASALELLYKNTAAQLFGVLRRILVRQDLAQEALQDVYVSIWRNAKDYRVAKAAAFTWMVSIARYRAIDIKRSRRREVQFADPAEYVPEDADARDSDLANVAARDADAQRLHACLKELNRAAQRGVSCVLERAHARRGRGHARLAARHRQELGPARPGKPQEVHPAMRYDDPNLLDSLAREYVIGTLHGRARRRFGRVLSASLVARRAVASWERQLTPLAASVRPVQPPAESWARIEAAIGVRKAKAPAVGGGWAALAAGLALVAVLFGSLYFTQRPAVEQPTYVAVVTDAATGPVWLMQAFEAARSLRVTTINPRPVPPGSSYELWMLPNGGAQPVSLGLIPGPATRCSA